MSGREEGSSKGRRVATALGFLSGVICCLDAVKEAGFYWPPADVWTALSHVKRMELGGGLALIAISLVVSITRGWNA